MKIVLCKFGKGVKKAGKILVWPLKKYIEFTARNYEELYGDKVQYINFGL